jgi:hypothetical protein
MNDEKASKCGKTGERLETDLTANRRCRRQRKEPRFLNELFDLEQIE